MTTRRDVSLVLADISKYQQQFAKIPAARTNRPQRPRNVSKRVSSKAAADSARAFQRRPAPAAADRAGNGPRGLAASLDTVAEKSGDVDSIIAGLGGAGLTRLQAVATGFSDAAGGLEAVSKAGVLSPSRGGRGIPWPPWLLTRPGPRCRRGPGGPGTGREKQPKPLRRSTVSPRPSVTRTWRSRSSPATMTRSG